MTPPSTDESGGSAATGDATVSLGDAASDWSVAAGVFGKFTEMNAREGYPGIYSEHLANGSFEEWYVWPKRPPAEPSTVWRRSEALFDDVEAELGVAYPWERVGDDDARVSYEHAVGGVHGRGQDRRERTDVFGNTYREPEPRFQRVNVWEGRAGVGQRVALPDQRTREYVCAVSARGDEFDEDCRLRLTDPDGTVLAEASLALTDEWERHEIELELDGESSERYRESPFGVFTLDVTVDGRGHVDLDWARLRAGDAVDGKFNPTTIENVEEYGIPTVRWPGGNFTSQYHWEDGIGPVEERPVRSELHWGGVEPNYLGTAEFLEFCEVAGVEPYLNVGFSHEITPAEAARWVEYVNGDPEETEMGALRADHGREEPWDVDVFQVGNEVWGTFQIGHTDPTDYGERYVEYYEAIKAVDPDVTVYAVGLDPGMETWGGASWNERLFEAAGDAVEGVDLHRYVHGEAGDRDWDEHEFNQQLVLFPSQFEAKVAELRETAAEYGVEDLDITVGEWNMGAGGLPEGRRAVYGTTAHAAFCAGMYNAFVRQGEAVRFGHQRDNAYKFRPFRSDLRPVWTANNAVLKLYTEPFEEGADWRRVPAAVDGPTGEIDRHGENIEPTADVPFVDAAAIRDADGETTHVYLANRNLREPIETTVRFDGGADATPVPHPDADSGTGTDSGTGSGVGAVTVTTIAADDPLDATTEWDGETSYDRQERTVTADGGSVTVDLAPAAVARVTRPE
ncbi:MAG: hypothetical protein ABEJ26_09715 [Halosimplex sp.]